MGAQVMRTTTMNYLSSLLSWSDSPTNNNTNEPLNNPHNHQYNIQQPPSSQYVSSLSGLQALDHKEDTQSTSPQSIASQASAFFSGWRSGSPSPSPLKSQT